MNIENSYESGSKLFPTTPKDSKSVANALRALNERIKHLENENIELKDQLIVFDTRANNDREKWQMRLIEEVQLAKDKEVILEAKVQERDNQIKLLKSKLSEEAKTKSTKSQDMYNKEIQSLSKEIENLKSLLNEKESHSSESKLLQEELKNERGLVKELKNEIKYLKEASSNVRASLQKNLETMENELVKQNEELYGKVKELQLKNKSLNDLNLNQARQIKYLRSEMSEILKFGGKGEDVKGKTMNPPAKPRRERPSQPSKGRSASEKSEPKVHKKQNSSQVYQEIQSNENTVKLLIEENEEKLQELNKKYKNLICLSGRDPADIVYIRKDLSKVAEEIDTKSDELYNLKRRHQDILKSKLYG